MSCLDLFLTMEKYVKSSHYNQISHNTTATYLYSSDRHYQTPFCPILEYWKGKEYKFHNNFSNLRKSTPASAVVMLKLENQFSLSINLSRVMIININLPTTVEKSFNNFNSESDLFLEDSRLLN